ncbi:MAG: 4Fe-4S binding protein [Candidatus Hydrogenedentes bacterium]|nr:4Fe-4S binding protein [Candidatus Hydrogenedentota bacterium]
MGMIHSIRVVNEQRQIAGKVVPVALVLRNQPPSRLHVAFNAVLGLFKGMWLTLRYFWSPEDIVTRQYPENRDTLTLTERFRGNLRFKFPNETAHETHAALLEHLAHETQTDANVAAEWIREDDETRWYHNCTGCAKCEEACPNASIRIMTRHGEILDDREIDRFVWRLDSCMFCNACVQACPWDAIEMTGGFENAVYDRRLLVYNLNRLAGPRINLIQDEANPEVRKRMIEKRDRYGGPVPLNGTGLPNLPPLTAALALEHHAGGPEQAPGAA